jgi:hypothetical protein
MKIYRSTKKSKRNTNKTVSEVRGQTYAELYRKLDMKEGKNDIYKIAML